MIPIYIPYLNKKMQVRQRAGDMQRFTVSSRGFGDVKLTGIVPLKKNQNSKWLLNFGVSIPTGETNVKDDMVLGFEEKPQMDSGYINRGFFVFNKKMLLNLTEDKNCDFADLIGESRKKKLLSPDAISLLHVIRKQRNIFAHNSLNPNTRYMRVIFLVAAFALLAEEIQSKQKL